MASTQTNGVNGNHKGHCIQAVLLDLESLNGKSFANEGERSKALVAAYALVARLDTPWEFVARFCMGQACSHTPLLPSTFSGSFFLFYPFRSRFEKSKRADNSFIKPALASALKVCKDLQLFDKWHEQYGDGELSSDKLAEIVGCDPALLGKSHDAFRFQGIGVVVGSRQEKKERKRKQKYSRLDRSGQTIQRDVTRQRETLTQNANSHSPQYDFCGI